MDQLAIAEKMLAKIDHALDWIESACKTAAQHGIADPPSVILAVFMARAEACGMKYESIVKAISHWRRARMRKEFRDSKREAK